MNVRHFPYAAITLTLALLVAPAVPASATTPQRASDTALGPTGGPATDRSGWVVSRRPSVASHIPAAKDQGNSTGGTNRVIRVSTGRYAVRMPGLGSSDPFGDVQVSSMGDQPRRCRPSKSRSSERTQIISIVCFGQRGFADSAFVVTYLKAIGGRPTSTRLAYTFMDHYDMPVLTPAGGYSSSGGWFSVFWTSPGAYEIVMEGMASEGGHVQVTSWAAPSCRPVGWDPAGADLSVKVRCVDDTGAEAQSLFSVLFLRRLGFEGFGGRPAAYLWADQPKADSYAPSRTYRYSSVGRPIRVTRSARGRYAVALAGMPLGGAAIVNAYGPGPHRTCQVASIRKTTAPLRIGVRCFAVSGALADSRFVLAWGK